MFRTNLALIIQQLYKKNLSPTIFFHYYKTTNIFVFGGGRGLYLSGPKPHKIFSTNYVTFLFFTIVEPSIFKSNEKDV